MLTKKAVHGKKPSETTLLNEIQLLLSEKRTYFSLLRTGLTVFTVPLTVIVFLVATSQYHNLFGSSSIGTVTIIALFIISVSGLSVFFTASSKLKNVNHLITVIKKENKRVGEIVI